jgi:hypothetical protein
VGSDGVQFKHTTVTVWENQNLALVCATLLSNVRVELSQVELKVIEK